MSMLIEKRNELMLKLAALETERKMAIDARVEEYRKTIEAQYPTDNIDKIKSVIGALDEVISYDDASIAQPVETVAEPMTEAQHQTVEPQARPGMATVFTPSRN